MSETRTLAPLLAALRDIVNWLKVKQVPGLVIGGVAASLLGRPRTTQDIDILVLIEEQSWGEFLFSGRQFGFSPRRRDTLQFAKKTRVLLVRHEPSGIDVDVVLGALPFEREAIARSVLVDLEDIRLPVPVPEDLIIMKAVSNRPRDLADIESIIDANPKLNLRRIRRLVREFSTAMEMPGILNDLETIIAKKRKKPYPGTPYWFFFSGLHFFEVQCLAQFFFQFCNKLYISQ